jgi:hypothetical protein
MSEPKGLRRRRRAGAGGVPEELARWFAGEIEGDCWEAVLRPELLPEHWREWVADHPGARPPQGYEWIASRAPRKERT